MFPSNFSVEGLLTHGLAHVEHEISVSVEFPRTDDDYLDVPFTGHTQVATLEGVNATLCGHRSFGSRDHAGKVSKFQRNVFCVHSRLTARCDGYGEGIDTGLERIDGKLYTQIVGSGNFIIHWGGRSNPGGRQSGENADPDQQNT